MLTKIKIHGIKRKTSAKNPLTLRQGKTMCKNADVLLGFWTPSCVAKASYTSRFFLAADNGQFQILQLFALSY